MCKKIMTILMSLSLLLSSFTMVNAKTDEISTFKKVAAGSNKTFMIAPDNSLWGCGYNTVGQTVGDGSDESVINKPLKIMDNVSMISPGGSFNMVVKTDNTLWGFGFNFYKVMGIGRNEMEYRTPVKIMDDVKYVSAGENHVFAIKTDNSLWAWGYNYYRQLGFSTFAETEQTPTKVMDNVLYAVAANEYSLVIKEDNTLWGWGANRFGKTGIGIESVAQYTPVKIMDNIVSVDANDNHAMAIDKDGVLWGWGLTNYSQVRETVLPPEDLDRQYTPIAILSDVASVSTGSRHTLAVKRDNTLWGWGTNGNAQLMEDPYITDKNKFKNPAKIMDGVKSISAGTGFSTAIKLNDTLWVCGSNQDGCIGLGDVQGTFAPAQIIIVMPESVSLNKTSTTLKTDASEKLSAIVLPSNTADKRVTWKSSNPAVAKVDANGKVTAVSHGTATITATTVHGSKVASCTVTVKKTDFQLEQEEQEEWAKQIEQALKAELEREAELARLANPTKISGVKSNGIFKKGVKLSFSDNDGIKSAKLNGNSIRSGYKLGSSKATKEGRNTLVVIDRKGNKKTIVFYYDSKAPKNATKVNAKPTKVTGKVEKNATVYVYKGSKLLKKVTCKTGSFSVNIKKQKKGTSLKIRLKDKAGNLNKGVNVKVK